MSTHLYTDAEDAATLSTEGSTSFHYSFSFLPREERHAMNTVYAFCRRIDDIVDDLPSDTPEQVRDKRERLEWWRKTVESISNARITENSNSLRVALAGVITRFRIPKEYFLTLIDGCERDLTKTRYATFAELKEYC